MPSASLARLESLLSARKLDHTLARAAPTTHGWASTGFAALDALLGGGYPRGQISEIIGPRSSGRQTALVSSLVAAQQRGELAAFVDPLDMFDPPSAMARGLDASQLLWVRGHALSAGSMSLPHDLGALRIEIDRALKALNLILQAGVAAAGSVQSSRRGPQRADCARWGASRGKIEATGYDTPPRTVRAAGTPFFGLVVLDLGEVPMPALARLPFTTWRRLHHVVEDSDTACVVIACEPLARSAGGITVTLDAQHVAHSAFSPHVRVLPPLRIDGSSIHARGMRTNRFSLRASINVEGAALSYVAAPHHSRTAERAG